MYCISVASDTGVDSCWAVSKIDFISKQPMFYHPLPPCLFNIRPPRLFFTDQCHPVSGGVQLLLQIIANWRMCLNAKLYLLSGFS
jgi:hypothetical protein